MPQFPAMDLPRRNFLKLKLVSGTDWRGSCVFPLLAGCSDHPAEQISRQAFLVSRCDAVPSSRSLPKPLSFRFSGCLAVFSRVLIRT